MLTSQQLTGRTGTHVREVPELRSTLGAGAAEALLAMRDSARAVGIELTVVSGFRSFERQAAIWNAKFKGLRPLLDRKGQPLDPSGLSEPQLVESILQWSALPGASRHHWGSDLDVIDAAAVPAGYRPQLVGEEFGERGVFAKLDAWLRSNMGVFGFFRPYNVDLGGVLPEPWHLSYAPIAVPALNALSIEVLEEAVTAAGLSGATTVLSQLSQIHVRYVRNVGAPETRPETRPETGPVSVPSRPS